MIDDFYINRVVKIKNNKAYYFDEKGIYRVIDCAKAYLLGFKSLSLNMYFEYKVNRDIKYCNSFIEKLKFIYYCESEFKKEDKYSYCSFYVNDGKFKRELLKNLKYSSKYYNNIFASLKLGDTFNNLLNKIKEFKIDEMILKIESFIISTDIFIQRETDNLNENSFDFIKIDCCTPMFRNDNKEFIMKYRTEILNYIIDKLENDISFKKYNVPINFLKLTKFTLTNDKHINLIFELKNNI